jgi:FMN phosphatase YigB (HAD superfamily)
MGKRIIMFDLDGTLYPYKGNSFRDTSLYEDLKQRSLEFITKKLNIGIEEATKRYDFVAKKYNFVLSKGFEKEYGLDRTEYLNFAWNMDPTLHIEKDARLISMLKELSRTHDLFILSDAPSIWINKLLEFFEVGGYFKGIFSGGDNNVRKKSGLYCHALQTLNADPKNVIMVGDEYLVDVIIPKKFGIVTCLVGDTENSQSDYNIKDIIRLREIL